MPGQPDAIYVAPASGGLFKSTNQGMSWTPVFDQRERDDVDRRRRRGASSAVHRVGRHRRSEQAAELVAGATASTNRSTAARRGRTWVSRTRAHIGRIVVHPTNADIVYVAAHGHLWGPNAERGVFKTTDGGRPGTKCCSSTTTPARPISSSIPTNPQTLFAAMYQRQRKHWGFNGGGRAAAFISTHDGGATWTKLTNGLPAGDKGRIGLDISRRSASCYAIVEAARPGQRHLSQHSTAATTWEKSSIAQPSAEATSARSASTRTTATTSTSSARTAVSTSRTTAGRHFRDVFSNVHGEDHALWIDPADTNHLIVGGDGGVSISWDRGQTWAFRDNLPVGQFYEISADMQAPT